MADCYWTRDTINTGQTAFHCYCLDTTNEPGNSYNMSHSSTIKWASSNPLLWVTSLSSVLTLGFIASNQPPIVSLGSAALTLALWAWFASAKADNTRQQVTLKNAREMKSARYSASICLQENVKRHLIPASESLSQMASVISDGTHLLQQSFTELASKSEQQQKQLSNMLKQLKGGDAQSDTLMIERFAKQIEKMIEEMASLEEMNTAHAQENMADMAKELMQANHYISGTIDSTSLIAKEIHQNVSTAVMAMQFEDSATQIAHYIQEQLESAKTSMEIMQQELLADTDAIQCLKNMEQRLTEQQSAEVHQAVTAKNMQEGDIDLF
jgi:hypothetical protein